MRTSCSYSDHPTPSHPSPLGFPLSRDAFFCSSSSWLGM
ncbi:hypothetical protein MUK42_32984 [Musa troglodytarum]|uniref:Uncharacterized protein n=1 Tax=Musa troglodytarum TaxID=320322 RepID=A0A9E7FEG2_9LILI|nr:hypothetical protein MUK42_32984 [Musa troglodytarum]